MKKTFGLSILLAALILSSSFANATSFGEIIKKDEDVLRLTAVQAKEYCGTIGGHLPSVREFVELAMSRGANGTWETAYPQTDYRDGRVQAEINLLESDSYRYVALEHQEQSRITTVEFYYRSEGYRKPVNHSGAEMLWSSSMVGLPNYVRLFNDGNGRLDYSGFLADNDTHAFLCAFGSDKK
jgi:hypothetical protein